MLSRMHVSYYGEKAGYPKPTKLRMIELQQYVRHLSNVSCLTGS